MKLFPSELDIDSDEGFTNEKDIFARRDFGQRLTRLVLAIKSPSVLLLDAPWGSGKTTFVKMWRGELKKNSIASVYFDAFANDYQSDAFVAIASRIIEEADAAKSASEKQKRKFKEAALGTAKVLVRAGSGLAIKAATLGTIEAEDVKGIVADIARSGAEAASKEIEAALKAKLDTAKADKASFENFRSALKELAGSLSQADGGGRLIVIVDELDRCKPPFALELIKKIKHFYNAANVVFVLVSNLPSLQAAVRNAYGDIDAFSYLEKFYQLRILFPSEGLNKPNLQASTYLRYLGCDDPSARVIEQWARATDATLRKLERVAAHTMLLLVCLEKRLKIPELIAVAAIVKATDAALYDDIRSGTARFSDLNQGLEIVSWNDAHSTERSAISVRTERWIKYVTKDPDLPANEAQSIAQSLFSYNAEGMNILQFYAQVLDELSLGSI